MFLPDGTLVALRRLLWVFPFKAPPPPPHTHTHARPQLIDRHREDLLPFAGELIANLSLHFPSDERPVRVTHTDRKEEAKPRSAGNGASVRDHLTRKSAM